MVSADSSVLSNSTDAVEHMEQNYAAQNIALSNEDLIDLETVFPRPAKPVPLQML